MFAEVHQLHLLQNPHIVCIGFARISTSNKKRTKLILFVQKVFLHVNNDERLDAKELQVAKWFLAWIVRFGRTSQPGVYCKKSVNVLRSVGNSREMVYQF